MSIHRKVLPKSFSAASLPSAAQVSPLTRAVQVHHIAEGHQRVQGGLHAPGAWSSPGRARVHEILEDFRLPGFRSAEYFFLLIGGELESIL